MSTPEVGDRAPDFSLASNRGPLQLSALLRKGPVLLVFYPGDDTPVCTKQLCNYRDNLGVFDKLGIQVVALNPQSEESHGKFADKHRLPFPVAADAGGTVTRAYGARGLLGMTKRALVLVGRDGKIAWRKTDFPIFYETADDVRSAVERLSL
ncbi:MAG TPA: peroxiredoxin [Myxococcota bacterium]|nr:peroxiredoxin [Myxococcota bacterium]